jgi:ubiquinone/menaquinone biosynthesis C-methylase UbiE
LEEKPFQQMKDLFSYQAKQYASFRPTYPRELYDFIFSHLNHFDMAWDAGTGNGQVASDLAKKFNKIMATDISARQLENAHQRKNIFYSQAGEVTDLPVQSVDLVTVGQAIHWFDREKFYQEVKRVAKPHSLLAVWGYGLVSIHPEIDLHLRHFYAQIVGPYWDKERILIDEQYRTLSFPFEEFRTPSFQFLFEWSLEELRGYLGTWSSVQKYILANKIDPVDNLINKIQTFWRAKLQTINFPLFLRLGKVN